MRDKTEQIIEAAKKVFIERGYAQATTADIAKESGVAELTLFRKFSTKQNLFLSVFQPFVEKGLKGKLNELAEVQDTDSFFEQILDERLTVISMTRPAIRMLVSEGLMNRFDKEINIPEAIFKSLYQALDAHFTKKGQLVDAMKCTRVLSGIFMSHLMWTEEIPYHQWSPSEKENYLRPYMKALKAMI